MFIRWLHNISLSHKLKAQAWFVPLTFFINVFVLIDCTSKEPPRHRGVCILVSINYARHVGLYDNKGQYKI